MLTTTLVSALVILLALVASGCPQAEKTGTRDAGTELSENGGSSGATEDASDKQADATPDKGGSTIDCENLTAPDASGATGADKKVAVIETEKGTIKFTFYPDKAPVHVANFIQLAECGFYSGTTFHRVEPGFVIQGGDPNSKTLAADDPRLGTGGPGYNIAAEFNDQPHLDGTVAMARSMDPDSAGSQFYIALGTLASLDGNYTVFGKVTEGLDVVHQITRGDKMVKVSIADAD